MTYLIEAFQNLLANRLRTILALVGLTVGVAAVLAIQILGGATAGALTGVFKILSNNTFLVFPDNQTGFNLKSGFKTSDVAAFTTLPGVQDAIPYNQPVTTIFIGHAKAQLRLAPTGEAPGFFPEPLVEGRYFTDDDIASRARVCILSDVAVQKLSPDGADLLGREVRAGSLRCMVVGILQKSPSGSLNFNFEPDVSVPYTTFLRAFARGSRIYEAEVLVSDANQMPQVEDEVKANLTALSHGKYKYATFDSRVIANAIGSSFQVLTVIVGFIGSISLVVAGIGIMNVLLVSITERTREIGVRKAIGGLRSQIMLQFFLEAALLTFTGCALGAAVGLFTGWWINVTYVIKISGVIVPVPWISSIVLAIVFATIVTLVFGTYPALRAARLDPIEALRYE